MISKRTMTTALTLCTVFGLSACSKVEQPATTPDPLLAAPAGVFVQLFEWKWLDVAAECENFLGPTGYAAVQISPPQEHVKGPQWWTRYQPVSYRIESRGGTRAEFAEMVQRCKAAGVDIYADALTNHMSGVGSGIGVAGSEYGEYSYVVPYKYDDFHHCDRNGNDSIVNYQDLWEVQNCQLGTLADLDTANPAVQEKIASYLNDLLSLGVAGFRLDAAKHIPHEDINSILQLLDEKPLIYQEVIDRGDEPISAGAYLGNGIVTEFKFPTVMVAAFGDGELAALNDFSTQPGWLPADKSVIFVDNHDLQRGHATSDRILNYKEGKRYANAVAFMLAYPYGYPMVMSSYRFGDSDQGPPASSPFDESDGCGYAWVCEHRNTAFANMVGFRKQTAGAGVSDWTLVGDTVLSFGRGERGHVIINNGDDAIEVSVTSSMPAGQYCDVISGGRSGDGCAGTSITVGDDGKIELSLEAMRMIAIYRGNST